MPVSPARAAAFDILLRVDRQRAFAVELLHSARLERLSPPDRALCTELVMGVLRWRSRLDRALTFVSSQPLERLDPEVLVALRLAAYQLTHLERVPGRAAVHESVELVKRARKRSAAPFVNAVLRKLSGPPMPRPLAEQLASAAALADAYAHPLWLVERWIAGFGAETAQKICAHDQLVPIPAFRLLDPGAEAELREEGIELAPGALLAGTRRVLLGDATQTRAFAAGRVYLQDEASQLVAALVDKGARLLDCCAAPGGKTSTIAARSPASLVVAVELHPHRAQLMRKLVRAPNVRIIVADAEALPLRRDFDRILADVPCSGTGTLARNPEIKWRLQPADLADFHRRQVAILRSALNHLAPGGRLIYSTCSLQGEENSDVVAEVMEGRGDLHLLDCRQELRRLKDEGELVWEDLDSLTSGSFFRTIPGIHPCDGFFAAMVERA